MTLERFGFIGMDKKCFWGSIGVLWKRPLPVEQILPNSSIVNTTKPNPPKPNPPKPPKPTPVPVTPGINTISSVIKKGKDVEVKEKDWKTFSFQNSKPNYTNQLWNFHLISTDVFAIESVRFQDKLFDSYQINATDGSGRIDYKVRV